MHQKLLTEITEFLSESGLSGYRFGLLAAKNGRLVERLRSGKRVWPETEAQVRNFIMAERTKRAAQQEGAAQ